MKPNKWICKLFLLCLSIVLFSSCHNEDKLIRQMCEDLHTRYPQATLQDIYKTCYQDYFGAEHLLTDTASARKYLSLELDECRETDMSAMPNEEPTGFRHRFCRINLSNVVNGKLSEQQLLAMFIEAAAKDNAFGDDWTGEWDKIASIALEVNPGWRDSELMAELQEAAQTNRAVRHSEAFRKAYNPHYRIVKQQ